MALDAKHHWCLSGTPLVNRVNDLGALFQFCRVPVLGEKAQFRTSVSKVFKKSFSEGFPILRRALLPICLRRPRDCLPSPHVVQCRVKLSTIECEAYNNLFRLSNEEIEATVSGNSQKEKRSTVLQAILRLRMFCSHGAEGTIDAEPSFSQDFDPDEELALLQEKGESSCVSCGSEVLRINQLQDVDSGLVGICGHITCRSCSQLDIEVDTSAAFHCSRCECTVTVKTLRQTQTPSPYFSHPSKLIKLYENLSMTGKQEKRYGIDFAQLPIADWPLV